MSLKGRCLKGSDLSNQDLGGTDIRGTNFTGANLSNTNLSNTRSGLQPYQIAIRVVLAVVLSFLFGIVAFSVGFIVGFMPSLWAVIAGLIIYSLLILALLTRSLMSSAASIAILIVTALISANFVSESGNSYAASILILTALGGTGVTAIILAISLLFVFVRTIASTFMCFCMAVVIVLGIGVGLLMDISNAYSEGSDVVTYDISFLNPVAILVLASLLAIGITVASALIAQQTLQNKQKYKIIKDIAVVLASFRSTKFCQANLTEANFSQASLRNADFRGANITRTNWFQSKDTHFSRTSGTYLAIPQINNLVVNKEGREQNFDGLDLRGLNLEHAELSDISLIGSKLSGSSLKGANLSRAKLVRAQLYNVDLSESSLTGAYIEDWSISLDTNFRAVKCDYIYMHLPTPDNPDPYRKPDNRAEIFQEGDFENFIAPITKTLGLYKKQNVDPRAVGEAYKTIDLFHHEGIDPSAAAIALKQLAELYPEAGIEVVALEGRGDDRIRLQARISNEADPSKLSREYFEQYREIKDLAYGDLQALLRGIEEKDSRIRSLENMVTTAIQQKTFYVETYQNMGDTVTEKRSIEFNAGGDISGISGIVGGDVSGVMNLGTISGNVTNSINQLPDNDSEKGELKNLLQQLQAAIEQEPNLEPEDKAEALEQVQTLAEAGQKPEDSAMQKAAKTAIKILKGTTSGLSETANLVTACNTLLPAISGLLLLL